MSGPEHVPATFTDLYELTMARAYLAEGKTGEAVFEAGFRTLPRDRGFVMAAGLGAVLDFLEEFRFTEVEIEHLRSLGLFPRDFLERLADLRFTGDVFAVPEGTIVFPNEPLAQIVAPIVEAQLVETFVLNQLHFQSVIATKAARVVLAAQGRTVVEFGARRAHGVDAALGAARASWIAGAAGTSHVQAGRVHGIPVFGTMAHAFLQAFDDEREAFAAFARLYPGTTLLVDTYDTLRGVDRVIEVAERLGERFDVHAIRLDSGDLGALAKAARAKLDAAGLQDVEIFVSSNLDEWKIAALLDAGAPIDGFGVGTQLATSADAPTLDLAYKLVAYEGVDRVKLSRDKTVVPGRKQVLRTLEKGRFAGDTLCAWDEDLPGAPLLQQFMAQGQRTMPKRAELAEARRRAKSQLAALPERLRRPDAGEPAYAVRVSEELERRLAALKEKLGG